MHHVILKLSLRDCELESFIHAYRMGLAIKVSNTLGDYTKGVRVGSNDFVFVEAFELRETVVEKEFSLSNRPVAVFAHKNIGNAFPF